MKTLYDFQELLFCTMDFQSLVGASTGMWILNHEDIYTVVRFRPVMIIKSWLNEDMFPSDWTVKKHLKSVSHCFHVERKNEIFLPYCRAIFYFSKTKFVSGSNISHVAKLESIHTVNMFLENMPPSFSQGFNMIDNWSLGIGHLWEGGKFYFSSAYF